jgi:Na+-driven multidrug efflux pump
MIVGVIVSVVALVIFQVFPRQIFSAFGNGSELYMEYGEMYLRTFLVLLPLLTLQPMANTFFSAIGKPIKGTIMALVKQVGIMIPMMFILTNAIGVNGVMYSGPISDLGAGILAIIMLIFEFRDIRRKEAAAA